MLRQASSRNQRSKGLRVKRILQICLLFAISIWLLYQLKHFYDKKTSVLNSKISAEGDPALSRLSRKVIIPLVGDETASGNETHEDKEKGDQEIKQENESGGGRDDNRIDETGDQDPEIGDKEPDDERVVQDGGEGFDLFGDLVLKEHKAGDDAESKIENGDARSTDETWGMEKIGEGENVGNASSFAVLEDESMVNGTSIEERELEARASLEQDLQSEPQTNSTELTESNDQMELEDHSTELSELNDQAELQANSTENTSESKIEAQDDSTEIDAEANRALSQNETVPLDSDQDQDAAVDTMGTVGDGEPGLGGSTTDQDVNSEAGEKRDALGEGESDSSSEEREDRKDVIFQDEEKNEKDAA